MATRRTFLKRASLAAAAAGLSLQVGRTADTTAAPPAPLKIGIRAASLRMAGTPEVFQAAARIPGIRGVELQATAGTPNLRQEETVRLYKREAQRRGLEIPSLAGVWDRGVKIGSPGAFDSLVASIRAAEMLGAGVVLVAFFREDAPDMASEESYAPIVALLQKAAMPAAEAGIILGLENSLSPADNKKLVDLVSHPAVGVYYDPHNMAHYGHGAEAIAGIPLLARKRLAMVHVKNGAKRIEEPGPIDWAVAFASFNAIGYDGWYVYETSHKSTEDCVRDTVRDNEFLRKHVRASRA